MCMKKINLSDEPYEPLEKPLTPNPPTPMSDQDRISPYNINTKSMISVMMIKKNVN